MKTFTAILLNIFYPGTGYLYLKDDFRKTIAKFLVFAWTLVIFGVAFELTKQLLSGNVYMFNSEMSVPVLGVAMWGFMVYDTFKLAQSQKNKHTTSKTPLYLWSIYEVTTMKTAIHGVKLRGRLRKLGLEKGFNILCENASDVENCVRFAVHNKTNATEVTNYLKHIIPDVKVTMVIAEAQNPVLSKLKVNKQERYTL